MKSDEIIDLVDRGLSARGVGSYEIFYLESEDLTLELKKKKVDTFEQAIDKSVSLRVVKDGRTGFSYCTKLEEDGLERMMKSAVDSSLITRYDENNRFSVKNYETLPDTGDYDAGIGEIAFEDKVGALAALEDAAYGYDEKVKSARHLEYRQSLKNVRIFNSSGIDCSHKKTVFSFSAIVAAHDGNESEISYESDFNNFYHKLDSASIGRAAAIKACSQLGGRVIGSGRMPVLLDRIVSSELLGVLAPSFFADTVMKNKSSLKGKIGRKILGEKVDIVDDPLFRGGIATFPFDAEGNVSSRTPVVEKGVLTGYLSDTYTSSKMGIANTSNSVKGSLFAPPSVGNTNFYLVPGKKKRDELVEMMGHGLVITEAMGLHTANPISGEFSIGIAGFLVDGGAVSFPVRGLVFTGNIFDILNNVVEVADDLKFYDKSAAPSILIDGAQIAGK